MHNYLLISSSIVIISPISLYVLFTDSLTILISSFWYKISFLDSRYNNRLFSSFIRSSRSIITIRYFILLSLLYSILFRIGYEYTIFSWHNILLIYNLSKRYPILLSLHARGCVLLFIRDHSCAHPLSYPLFLTGFNLLFRDKILLVDSVIRFDETNNP